MAGVKKTISQKEKELIDLIKESKEKLHKLQNKQRLDLGELACKHGLHEFDRSVIDASFKDLSVKLGHVKK